MFLPNAFSTVSFSPTAFKMASDARSGYWRLFFMNMQEEALKPKVKEEVKEVIDEVVAVKPKKKKPSKKVIEVKEEVSEKPIPIIPFRRLPTKMEPTVYDELAKLPEIAIEQYLFVIKATATLYNFDAEKEKRRKHRRKVAAFLLMAA